MLMRPWSQSQALSLTGKQHVSYSQQNKFLSLTTSGQNCTFWKKEGRPFQQGSTDLYAGRGECSRNAGRGPCSHADTKAQPRCLAAI